MTEASGRCSLWGALAQLVLVPEEIEGEGMSDM